MIPRAYIGGPYTHDTRAGRVANTARARRVARAVFAKGVHPVCPHLTGIELEDVWDPGYEWWMEATSQELETCQVMVVVHGYESSDGTKEEIEQTTQEDQPTFYANEAGELPPEFDEWLARFLEDRDQ